MSFGLRLLKLGMFLGRIYCGFFSLSSGGSDWSKLLSSLSPQSFFSRLLCCGCEWSFYLLIHATTLKNSSFNGSASPTDSFPWVIQPFNTRTTSAMIVLYQPFSVKRRRVFFCESNETPDKRPHKSFYRPVDPSPTDSGRRLFASSSSHKVFLEQKR